MMFENFLYAGESIDHEALAARERDSDNEDWLVPVVGEYVRVYGPKIGISSTILLKVYSVGPSNVIAFYSPEGNWCSNPSGCGFCYHNKPFGEWFPLSCIKTKARLALEELGCRNKT